jgi:hypothetical protein
MINEYGAVGGIKIGRGNQHTQKERTPVPFCPNPTDFNSNLSVRYTYQKLTPTHNSTQTGPAVFYLLHECRHGDVAKRSTERTLSESQGFSNIWSTDKYTEHSKSTASP